MKNLFKYLALLVMGVMVSASCNGTKKNDVNIINNKQNNEMDTTDTTKATGKTLIVFFSHAGENYSVGNVKVGNTKLVADEIQKLTGGDEFEIVCEKNYNMPYDDLTRLAKEEQYNGEKPAFKGKIKNIEQYETVFIGGPIWWGTYPQVMFSFFDKYDLNGKTIIPFSTHEGSGLGSVVEDLKKLYPQATFKEAFSIYGHEARKSTKSVDAWVKELGY